MFGRWTGVHESLSYHTQARVDGGRFVDVEYKVWILDEIYPEPGDGKVGNGNKKLIIFLDAGQHNVN